MKNYERRWGRERRRGNWRKNGRGKKGKEEQRK
jgi:hypothetical protein